MKHLVIKQYTYSEEGLIDSIKEKYQSLRTKVFGSGAPTQEDLTLAEKAATEMKSSLQKLRDKIRQTSFKEVDGNTARGLHMLGFDAKNPQQMINYLKNFEKEFEKIIDEEKSNAQKALKKILPDKLAMNKDKELTASLKKKSDTSTKKMTFTKNQVLELVDVGISYCDTFLKNKKKVDSVAMEGIAMESIGDWILEVLGKAALYLLKFAVGIFLIVFLLSFPFHTLVFLTGYKLAEYIAFKAEEMSEKDPWDKSSKDHSDPYIDQSAEQKTSFF